MLASELKSGKDFEEVVKAFSDERGASTRAGSLGAIGLRSTRLCASSVCPRHPASESRRRVTRRLSHRAAYALIKPLRV